jgi:hypothetical protein
LRGALATSKLLKSKGPTAVGPFGVFPDYEVFRPVPHAQAPPADGVTGTKSRFGGRFRDRRNQGSPSAGS